MPLLSIQNLSIGFKKDKVLTPALQNISFEVNKGEIVAIVGESGSGKSITALSILKLLSPKTARYTSGHIFFELPNTRSTDILSASKKTIRKIRGHHIAMIFQEPMTSLNPVFTCGDQVMESIQLHQKVKKTEAHKKTIDLFSKVKLPYPDLIFDRYPHQLSGGQKQRVMIAMAMSSNPSLLICDEPTTALDVTVQKNILQLIRELQQKTKMGVVFITHDLGVVAEIADRIVVMYKGNIVEQGSTRQIMQQAQHPYTKGLLACRPILHPKGERLPMVADFLEGRYTATTPLQPPTLPQQPLQNNTPSSPVLLSVQHLKVWYHSKKKIIGNTTNIVKAVDDVSFDVHKGETLGLVGESGCGKTTVGRALLRLVEPTQGKILLNEEDIVTLPNKQMRKLRKEIQLVFQDPYSALNPRMTIGHAIAEVLKVHRLEPNATQRKEKAIALLEKVSLTADHYNRYPHEFSGGQRQRIVIARALATQPSFLVCDESVSALDVSVQAQVLNLLNDLKKEFGFTVIFISHDLGVVHYISNRIMVMQRGKIVEIGNASQVFFHPQQEYTKRLIASIPKG
jgi:peptide/nickel transport system ATP-binding protein